MERGRKVEERKTRKKKKKRNGKMKREGKKKMRKKIEGGVEAVRDRGWEKMNCYFGIPVEIQNDFLPILCHFRYLYFLFCW